MGDDGAAPTGPDPAATTRKRAAALAGHTGDADAARAATRDEAGAVRATAWGALARLGVLTDDDVDAAAADPDPVVRRRAAELLAEPALADADADDPDDDHAHPGRGRSAGRSTRALLGLLGDDDPSVQEVAAWAAGEHLGADRRDEDEDAPAEVVDRLAELATGHDDALVREAAVAALGAVGDRRGLTAILVATNDRATVRRRAVLALAPFDGDEVDAALTRATEDRDWQVRQAAEDLLDPDR